MYLTVCNEFFMAFSSRELSLEKRIEMVAYVLAFVRGWNSWLCLPAQRGKYSRDRNGLSNQAYCDLELCVGAFVSVVGIIADWPRFQHTNGKATFDPERMVSPCWLACALTASSVTFAGYGHC